MPRAAYLTVLLLFAHAGAWSAFTQAPSLVETGRLAVLMAEARGAAAARDLATIRAGLRSRDAQTIRLAVRALGRLERPELVADLIPRLRHPLPEIRAEAANAIGQAAQGLRGARGSPPLIPAHRAPFSLTAVEPSLPVLGATAPRRGSRLPPVERATLALASMALAEALSGEEDANVRAAIAETLGRLPYTSADQVEKAEQTILALMARTQSSADRLGVAAGLETRIRLQLDLMPPTAAALDALRSLATGTGSTARTRIEREARVRRRALEALIMAGVIDGDVAGRAAADPDAQVRRLAMRALSTPQVTSAVADGLLRTGLDDPSPMVRLEALRSVRARETVAADGCAAAMRLVDDPSPQVALAALDQLADCPTRLDAVAVLERAAGDLAAAGAPRGWHRPAHAMVALASAAPQRAAAALEPLAASSVWQLRMYAARAAALIGDRSVLEELVQDGDDTVRAAANQALTSAAGVPAPRESERSAPRVALDASELRRVLSAKARVTIRGVGTFELALLAAEAPLSVIQFVRLAESGELDGSTFLHVAADVAIQGPRRTRTIEPLAPAMKAEVGQWPHVRGAVGIATGGGQLGGGAFFIDLVDNPRFDHEHAVFAHVLNGIEIVDALLEGDVIEKIEIVPGA